MLPNYKHCHLLILTDLSTVNDVVNYRSLKAQQLCIQWLMITWYLNLKKKLIRGDRAQNKS